MLTDEDLRASEEYFYRADDRGAIYGNLIKNVAKDAFLAGIEYERKRTNNIGMAMFNATRALAASVPVEPVGERHWRIKDP